MSAATAPVAAPPVEVGCDLVDVDRFADLLRRRPRVRDELFTSAEQADAVRGGCGPADVVAVRRLAARFAAKEALAKAWRRPELRWTDVEVRLAPDGAPLLAVHGRPRPDLRVSLSHDGGRAMAVVIALGPASALPDHATTDPASDHHTPQRTSDLTPPRT